MSDLVTDAQSIARDWIESPLPRRWSHIQAVAAKAEMIAPCLDIGDRDALIAAAWLHDIGYAPKLALTGFHPLDGARWLRSNGFDERVTRLVANHSCALLEADERGLREELEQAFPVETSSTADALIFCDMTTGPDGQTLDVEDRLAEIRTRYGPDALVTRFITRAEPGILAAVERTERRQPSVSP